MIISFQMKFSTHIKNLHLISVIRKFCVENGGLAVDFLMFTGCEINFDFLWLSDLALINRNLASCDVHYATGPLCSVSLQKKYSILT